MGTPWWGAEGGGGGCSDVAFSSDSRQAFTGTGKMVFRNTLSFLSVF